MIQEIINKKKPIIANLPLTVLPPARIKKIILKLIKTNVDMLILHLPTNQYFGEDQLIAKYQNKPGKDELNLAKIINLIREIKKKSNTPLILATVTNLILAYGLKQFFTEIKTAGLDALNILDLPPEEAKDFIYLANMQKINIIFSLTDNSAPERIKVIADCSQPFIRLTVARKIGNKKELYFNYVKETLENIKKITNKSLVIETSQANYDIIQRLLVPSNGIILTNQLISWLEKSDRRAEKELKKLIRNVDKK